jgi:hypothetical protein
VALWLGACADGWTTPRLYLYAPDGLSGADHRPVLNVLPLAVTIDAGKRWPELARVLPVS